MTATERVIDRRGEVGYVLGFLNSQVIIAANEQTTFDGGIGVEFWIWTLVPPTTNNGSLGDNYYLPSGGVTVFGAEEVTETPPTGYTPIGFDVSNARIARLSDTTALLFVTVFYRSQNFDPATSTETDSWLASVRVFSIYMTGPSDSPIFVTHLSPSSLVGFVSVAGIGSLPPIPDFDVVEVSSGSGAFNVTPGTTYSFSTDQPDNSDDGYIFQDGSPALFVHSDGSAVAWRQDMSVVQALSNVVQIAADEWIWLYGTGKTGDRFGQPYTDTPILLARWSSAHGFAAPLTVAAGTPVAVYLDLRISRHDCLDAYPGFFHVLREYESAFGTLQTTEVAKVTYTPGASTLTVSDWLPTSTFDGGSAS